MKVSQYDIFTVLIERQNSEIKLTICSDNFSMLFSQKFVCSHSHHLQDIEDIVLTDCRYFLLGSS